ncbi:unnamed protein product [Lupinus luteus]|uniref:Uncharacterized protein n=1 Tax=Lupinus luteus TaxID=3873 RepID=A0AAV1XC37_LUPLU
MASIGTLFFLFFGLLIGFGSATRNETIVSVSLQEGRSDTFLIAQHRKLLHSGNVGRAVEPNDDGCNKEHIVINQSPGAPLFNGIPTYNVEIVNNCFNGCKISDIHLACGWFSSASVINPGVFKRLDYNDCIVNAGNPLEYGSIISFWYANTFPYPLLVTKLTCL